MYRTYSSLCFRLISIRFSTENENNVFATLDFPNKLSLAEKNNWLIAFIGEKEMKFGRAQGI